MTRVRRSVDKRRVRCLVCSGGKMAVRKTEEA